MATFSRWLIAPVLLCLTAHAAAADDVSAADGPAGDRERTYEDRIEELERTVGVLATELERTRRESVVPESPDLKSKYGMGPSASKVFDLSRGLSLGGYGEINYTGFVGDKGSNLNKTDALRGVLYVGYKFSESIVFNSEIEIEHADEIFLEFAELNFMWKEWANAKAGLLLLPMGFLNEIHEPPFFFGVNRPDVERQIIPSTWRENGVGFFGGYSDLVHYKLYAVNGLDASGFGASGIRGGRQKGSKALAEHFAVVGRIDITPTPETLFGASFYYGGSGQNQKLSNTDELLPDVSFPDAETTVFDLHAQYKAHGLHLRGLFTMAFVDDAGDLTRARMATDEDFEGAIAKQMLGGYAEIAYDIWPWLASTERSFEPFYRYEYYDTQHEMPSSFSADRSKEIQSHTVGFNFKPITNVVLKLDYRNRDPKDGTIADEINVGVGYVF
ncbi:MAG: hypothetical protein JRH16_20460 [Deltaproteobacteria bacterium]|nr:hypothetical protein [Deltaproteobacteria bacterium]MBW2362777.1 hypothetical protein [Deltaproteobacteria bacterium]